MGQVEFSIETFLSQTLVFRKFFYYKSYFTSSDQFGQNFCLTQSWHGVCFQKRVLFFQLVHYQHITVHSIVLRFFAFLGYQLLFLFFDFLLYLGPLFLLVNLARGLSILFIYSKIQLLVLQFFYFLFLTSILFLLSLVFIFF